VQAERLEVPVAELADDGKRGGEIAKRCLGGIAEFDAQVGAVRLDLRRPQLLAEPLIGAGAVLVVGGGSEAVTESLVGGAQIHQQQRFEQGVPRLLRGRHRSLPGFGCRDHVTLFAEGKPDVVVRAR
jgi:hypothetical protein